MVEIVGADVAKRTADLVEVPRTVPTTIPDINKAPKRIAPMIEYLNEFGLLFVLGSSTIAAASAIPSSVMTCCLACCCRAIRSSSVIPSCPTTTAAWIRTLSPLSMTRSESDDSDSSWKFSLTKLVLPLLPLLLPSGLVGGMRISVSVDSPGSLDVVDWRLGVEVLVVSLFALFALFALRAFRSFVARFLNP